MFGIGIMELLIVGILCTPVLVAVFFLVQIQRRNIDQGPSKEDLSLLRELVDRMGDIERRLDSLESATQRSG